MEAKTLCNCGSNAVRECRCGGRYVWVTPQPETHESGDTT